MPGLCDLCQRAVTVGSSDEQVGPDVTAEGERKYGRSQTQKVTFLRHLLVAIFSES